MHPMLNIAVRAARSAGNIIARSFENYDEVKVEQKGQNDLVTNIDKTAEQTIIAIIKKAYPDHSFVGEEFGEQAGENSDYLWIIDPLDGTKNYVNGIPHFAVSVALKVKGKLDQAVIYDPIRSELFTASRGAGAQLNGYRIRCNQPKELTDTLLATGFPHKSKQRTDEYLAMFGEFFQHASDIRRAGSAALDLAYVAAGRVDGYWEMNLKPWDTAAGQLLVREAGGMIADFNGGNEQDRKGDIVAAYPKLMKQMIQVTRNDG